VVHSDRPKHAYLNPTFEFVKHFMVLNRWVCAGEMWRCSRNLVGGLKVTDQVLHFSIMINLFDLPNSMKLMGGEGYLQVSRGADEEDADSEPG